MLYITHPSTVKSSSTHTREKESIPLLFISTYVYNYSDYFISFWDEPPCIKRNWKASNCQYRLIYCLIQNIGQQSGNPIRIADEEAINNQDGFGVIQCDHNCVTCRAAARSESCTARLCADPPSWNCKSARPGPAAANSNSPIVKPTTRPGWSESAVPAGSVIIERRPYFATFLLRPAAGSFRARASAAAASHASCGQFRRVPAASPGQPPAVARPAPPPPPASCSSPRTGMGL